jgi:TonB family protein
MSNPRHFWRNVGLIGLAHAIAVVGVIRWNAGGKTIPRENVVWLTGDTGSGGGGAIPQPMASRDVATDSEPTPIPSTAADDEPSPVALAAKSEIELPAPTATPTPTPIATPRPVPKEAATPMFKAQPKPSPRPPRKPRPKPTPRPTPKPTPKPKPRKTILAKASPRPTPPEIDESDREEAREEPVSSSPAEPSRADGSSSDTTATSAATGSGPGPGHGRGAARNSELAAFSRMLHDRLYSEWSQPTTAISSGAKISTLVRLRIEKDGRLSKFEIIKSSGNVMIDESVAAIGKHVTQVDPPPPALRSSGHYDVKINFELNPE